MFNLLDFFMCMNVSCIFFSNFSYFYFSLSRQSEEGGLYFAVTSFLTICIMSVSLTLRPSASFRLVPLVFYFRIACTTSPNYTYSYASAIFYYYVNELTAPVK